MNQTLLTESAIHRRHEKVARMIVTAERLERFRNQGFFVLEDFFTSEAMDEAARLIERFTEDHSSQLAEGAIGGISRRNEILFTAFLAEHDPGLLAFVRQPKLSALTAELIGPDVRLYWNQSVYKFPETEKEFPWHQDNGYTPVEPEQYYTCWIALNEATRENGCIWVLPGSHANGTLPHEPSDIGQVGYRGPETGIPLPLKKGDMAVFSSLLLHRSGPNLTPGVRKAYVVQYIPAHARNGATGEPFDDRRWVTRHGAPVSSD